MHQPANVLTTCASMLMRVNKIIGFSGIAPYFNVVTFLNLRFTLTRAYAPICAT